jgi:hypothetical protein
MSTFRHNGVQSILNEEKPPWQNLRPPSSLMNQMWSLTHVILHGIFFIIDFQHLFAPYSFYRILQTFTLNEY